VLFRDLWRTRLDDYVRAGEAQLKALAAEIERPDLFAGTRHRLEHLKAAIAEDLRTYREVFRDFVSGGAGVLPQAPASAVVAEYSENLFRDFVWGQAEAAGTLELVRRLAPPALGKTAVEVPDQAGFVVNRLLFPYLFEAVRMIERTGLEAGEVDTCMKLGAGHPMGPLALLDFVGLDVSEAIGDSLYAENGEAASKPPGLMVEMVGEGKLGRKSGAGFYTYD